VCEITLVDGLPFVQVVVAYRGREIELNKVLLDTGSGGTVFSADRLLDLGVRFQRGDTVHRIRGVGGSEFVFNKRVNSVSLGSLRLEDFEIEVGALDYGFEIDGLLGTAFLEAVGAVIDLRGRQVTCRTAPD